MFTKSTNRSKLFYDALLKLAEKLELSENEKEETYE
jgi:hypothetical protein